MYCNNYGVIDNVIKTIKKTSYCRAYSYYFPHSTPVWCIKEVDYMSEIGYCNSIKQSTCSFCELKVDQKTYQQFFLNTLISICISKIITLFWT